MENISDKVAYREAMDHAKQAIVLCDKIGAVIPAAHIQHGLDILKSLARPEGTEKAK